MLTADIGTPQTSLKNLSYNLNREFMTYQTRTKVPLSDYTVIGNTTSTRLYHPELRIGPRVYQRAGHLPHQCVWRWGLVWRLREVSPDECHSAATCDCRVLLPPSAVQRVAKWACSFSDHRWLRRHGIRECSVHLRSIIVTKHVS